MTELQPERIRTVDLRIARIVDREGEKAPPDLLLLGQLTFCYRESRIGNYVIKSQTALLIYN